MKRLLLSIATGLLAVGTLPAAALAAAPVPGATTPRSVAVSVPTDPVDITPGQSAKIPIRVVNPGATPVDVAVIGRGVALEDNGVVKFTGTTDPVWSSQAVFPGDYLTVPAGGFIEPTIQVTVPAGLRPDLYFIGFVVTPRPSGSGVVLINQVGNFLTVNVPGPRVRKLDGTLTVSGITIGPIKIGDRLDGQVLIRNTGPSAVQFFGENDVTSSPFGGTTDQHRFPKSLLPTGRSRVIAVTGMPGFPVSVVTLNVTLAYPGLTESSTQQVVRTTSILVISPWVPAALIAVLAALLLWRVYRVLRSRSPG